MAKRKVTVVTGTRADYGLLRWTMQAINDSPQLELNIVATMMHLSREFGMTYKEIERNGFSISEKLEMLENSDTATATANAISRGISGFAEIFTRRKPDIVLVLGDRVEMLAAATAATICQVPLAHIHGGETTEGLIDEPIRHSITKMSHLHFTTTEIHKNRVIQLGENPERVFQVGAPGLEAIRTLNLLSKEQLEKELSFKFGEQMFVVTYHPVTLEKRPEAFAFKNMLDAFESFPDAKFIITYPNSDTNCSDIIAEIKAFERRNRSKAFVSESLGQLRYLSAVSHCSAVIGNSSSALIEVPALKKPTVNIGRRQLARVAPESVIHCSEEAADIAKAIKRAISPAFQRTVQLADPLYGDGHVASKIVRQLELANLDNILFKSFFDLDLK